MKIDYQNQKKKSLIRFKKNDVIGDRKQKSSTEYPLKIFKKIFKDFR